MKVFKKVQVEQEQLDYKECDICKEKFKNTYDWEKSVNDIAETDLTLKTGERCYESGSAILYSLDVCAVCFKTKLIPLIEKEYGVKFKKEEIEW